MDRQVNSGTTWAGLHRASILPSGTASIQEQSSGQVHGGFYSGTALELSLGNITLTLQGSSAPLWSVLPWPQHWEGEEIGREEPTLAMPSLLFFVLGEGEKVTSHQLPPYTFCGWEEPPAGVL